MAAILFLPQCKKPATKDITLGAGPASVITAALLRQKTADLPLTRIGKKCSYHGIIRSE